MSAERMPGAPALARTAATVPGSRVAHTLFVATVFLFVLSTLFDPADMLFGLKVPLFMLCWAAGIIVCVTQRDGPRLPIDLIIYSLLMISVPLLSIWHYYLVDGSEPFQGFQLLKAYVFISMAALLYLTNTNLLKYLSVALTILAISIIGVAALVLAEPAFYLPLYAIGNQFGIFSIDNRDYGSGLVLFQMYFVTSPMLAISAAYYFDRAAAVRSSRVFYGGLALLSMVALALAGSRNNLIAAIVLPLILLLFHARRKILAGGAIVFVAGLGLAMLVDEIRILLDPAEASNSTKLALLTDYGVLFGRGADLLFGTGLGAYEHWTGRGLHYISEFTYLEVIRNFGLIMGAVIILLLAYPALYAFVVRPSYNEKSVVIGYIVYLGMCASNPNLFSSMGMLILSVLVANISLFNASASVRSSPRS